MDAVIHLPETDDAGELHHLGRGQELRQAFQHVPRHGRRIERRGAGIGEAGAFQRVLRPVVGIQQGGDVVGRVAPALAVPAAGRGQRVAVMRHAIGRPVEGAAERRDSPLELAVEMARRIPHHGVVEPDQAFEKLRAVHVEPERVGQEAHAPLIGIDGGGEIAGEAGAVGVGDRGIGFVLTQDSPPAWSCPS